MIIDTTITLVTGIIGSLPIPGAGLIADAYGLVLGWITGIGQEYPWKKLEDSLKQYVDEAVLGLELNTLKNDIADIERRFDSFCKGRTASNWKPGDTLSRELETRLISCYEGVQRIQQFLYNPNSNKHTTLPYFERCSTLYFAVMSSVTQCLKSYNIPTEYETFFNQTYAYLDGAYASSGAYKSSKIQYKWGGFFNHLNYVIDEGKTDLTDWWAQVDHPSQVLFKRYYYLPKKVPYYFKCQLGIHRMFASYDSLVKIYNDKIGRNLPLLTPMLDEHLNGFLKDLHKYMDEITALGYSFPPGIRYDLYRRHSFEDLKGASFYEHSNYQGKSVQLTVGSYPEITKKGISDNSLSSVKVPSPWKVTLYEDPDFKGASTVLKSDTTFVGNNFNDKTSSIKVEIDLYQ